MEDFQQFGLPQPLLNSLTKMGFNKPTPIQAEAIPLALEGHDILGSAQTGTGKTGAFAIPIVAKLIEDPKSSALIITPTRELAAQIVTAVKDMIGFRSKINTALIIGGESMGKQIKQLNARPRLFVGTPGRLNDHLERGNIDLRNTKFLVLDETDRMLDMGFAPQIERILSQMSDDRQTMLFSATMPKNIVSLSKKYLIEPKRVAVGSTFNPAKNIKQEVVYIDEKEKFNTLLSQVSSREGSIIVFVKTKFGAERLAKKLRDNGQKSDAVHGDLRQNKRDGVIKDFRSEKFRILVATDVAARGLDIPHIEHVINYDLPQCPEDYIHRIGRTARAGAEGEALCFVTKSDTGKWSAITKMMSGSANDDNAIEDDENASSESRPRRSRSGRGSRDGRGRASSGRSSADRGGFAEKKKKKYGFSNKTRNRGEKSEGSSGDRRSRSKPKSAYSSTKPKRYGSRKSSGEFKQAA